MDSIQNQKDLIELSSEEVEEVDTVTEEINNMIDEVSAGLDYNKPVRVKLPEKANRIIPEIIAKLEGRIILIFTSEGCNIATGFGSQTHSRRIVPMYQSTNQDKMYQFFGMKFFTEKVKIPTRIVNEMTYREMNKNTVHLNAWGKEKVVEFLENFDPIIPVDEKRNIFLKKLEDEKEYERAAEWMEQLPQATRRNLYNLRRGDVLLRSAYKGNHKRGLTMCRNLADFKNRVYISHDRERYQIETDLIVYEYNRVPMGECEGDGLFEQAGPLLAIQLNKKLTELMQENYIPRSIICDGYRLPTKKIMFIAHTPALQSMEDIELMYDEIINTAIETGVDSINLPVLGADLRVQKGYSIKKLVKLFKRKVGRLVRDTSMKIIISFGNVLDPTKIMEYLGKHWKIEEKEEKVRRKRRKRRSIKNVNLVGDKLVKFAARLNGKSGVALVDPGSEISMIEERWLKSLKEGRDYEYIEDLRLLGPGDNEIPNKGTVRIKPHAGLQLNNKVQRIGMEACIVDNPRGDRSWDLLIGNDLPLQLGKLTIQIEEDKKPLVMIEPTEKAEIKLKTLEGENAEEVVLDTLPAFYKGVYASNLTILEPFEEKEVHTDMDYAGQVMNLNDSNTRCYQLSKNYEMINGAIEKNFQAENVLKIRNDTGDNLTIEKDSLVAYAIQAEEAMITLEGQECGRKHCNHVLLENTSDEILKPDEYFVNHMIRIISEELRKESDKDIEYWKGELKATLSRLKDEGILSSREKDRIWRESRFYSVGFLANYVGDWKTKLQKKQEEYLLNKSMELDENPEELIENTELNIQHRKGDLDDAIGEIAFSWNRKYENENEIHDKLESKYKIKDMSETGAYIGEAAILKRKGKFIYGLITKKDSKGGIEIDTLKECLEYMKNHAVREKVSQIEFQNMKLDGNETLGRILETTFKDTGIVCCIVSKPKVKRVNTATEKIKKKEEFRKKGDVQTDPKMFSRVLEDDKYLDEIVKNNSKNIREKRIKEEKFVNQTKIKVQSCKELVLKRLKDFGAILKEDLQSVEETPEELFNEYIERENFEIFAEYFLEVSKVNIKPFKFPEDRDEAAEYSDLEHIINNFRRFKLGKYYGEDPNGRTRLKLIVFKYRELFAKHKWNVGRIRKDFYVHRAVFKNDRYHKTKCRPFRLSPREKQVIAKYLKNLCENDIVTPVAEGHAGVNLFLVSKNSPGGKDDKEGNEGVEKLRAQYEKEFNLKPENSKVKKKVNIKETKKSYEDFKNENNIKDEEDLMDEYESKTPDTWKMEHVGMDLTDDHIKNTQTFENGQMAQITRVPNLLNLKSDEERERTIDFLEGEAKRDLSSEEIQRLGEPESQFSKCHGVRKIHGGPINMSIGVALTYRMQSQGNSQTILTNIQEARKTLIQAIQTAKDVSLKHQPHVFARAQGYGKIRRKEYTDYLDRLNDYYERNLTISNWNNIKQEKPYCNEEEAELFKHFCEELPYYLSLMNRMPLSLLTYHKGIITSVRRFCMRDRGIPYDLEEVRTPLFIACTAGRDDYTGLRIPNGDYLHYIMQYMEDKKVQILDQDEFNRATDLYFNMDTRLTKEKPTKSEDDLRKTNLENTLRDTKDLTKNFNRTSQTVNYRPVVNCLLMNMSVHKNVTVLPEPRKDIQKIANMKIKSTLDFSNFFFQISADKQYGKDVCLITELGTYQPNVALQGDTNSPGSSTFISNSLLYKVRRGCSLIDDILFANNTVEEHLEDFERILSNIAYVSEAQRPCKLRTDKISLLGDKAEYCGNILQDGKVRISSHKLEDYLRKEPTTYGQLTSVICLANWYAPALSVGSEVFKEIRDEIKSYSSSVTIKWTDKLKKNYNQVINLLREVPQMYIPDWYAEDLTFTIHVDSSQMAIGCLLGQEVPIKEGEKKPSKVHLSGKGLPGSANKKDPIKTVIRPITYYSRVLLPNEKNLPIMHLELKAMYEACLKFREYTRERGCKLKLYSDNSGVYYILKKMLQDPNLRLDDQMAKLVALLHGTQAEIHFVSTEMNPADFMTRVIPHKAGEEEVETRRINNINKLRKEEATKEEQEFMDFMTRGKATERHKRRMELPKVNEDGETNYKHQPEEYEQFDLGRLFDKLSESTQRVQPTGGVLINRRNIGNLIEKAIVNHVQTDQFGMDLKGGMVDTELEELRIKQRGNPLLKSIIKELETGKKKVINRQLTHFKMWKGVLLGNASPHSSKKFKYVLPEEETMRVAFTHHKTRHLGINKLYQQLNEIYLWNTNTGSKRDIRETVELVVKSCLDCAVYQRPSKHHYFETVKTLHASQQYNCGAVIFMDHYSIGKTTSKYKEMIGAVCGRCKRAMVEPVERANSTHTAQFIMKQICNPLIPSRLISDHGSPISLGTVPKLLEAINSGISNFYNLKPYEVGGEEEKQHEALETAHALQRWKDANKEEYKNDEEKQKRMHDVKRLIEEGRIMKKREERQRMKKLQWQQVHRNKDVRRMEHVKSSVYRPTSHSSIERFFLTFSTLIRKLFKDENNKWTDYVDQVVAIYNNTGHKALRGHSPNSAHFNLAHDQTYPMVYQYLNESRSNNPFVVEEKRLFNRALRVFTEAGIEKYFEPVDRKEREARKHEGKTGPQIGDLVWVKRMKRLNKHPEEGYLMGPGIITRKPSSQQVDVMFALNGITSRRHIGQIVQFYKPIGTDTEKLLEYSSAPRLYTTIEGRRVSNQEREKLIKELETGMQGKNYLSSLDDLAEVDMLLEDKFSLLDHPEEYSEKTEELRKKFESDTPEGQMLRDQLEEKIKEAEGEQEIEEFSEEDYEDEQEEEIYDDEEEEETGKTVRWNLPEKTIGCDLNEDHIIEGRKTRSGKVTFNNVVVQRKRADGTIPEKAKFPTQPEPEESIEDEITYLLALAKRNMQMIEMFQKQIEIEKDGKKRTPRRVKFKGV